MHALISRTRFPDAKVPTLQNARFYNSELRGSFLAMGWKQSGPYSRVRQYFWESTLTVVLKPSELGGGGGGGN